MKRDMYAQLQDKCSCLSELHKYAFQTVSSKDDWELWGYQMVVDKSPGTPTRGSPGAEAALHALHPV